MSACDTWMPLYVGDYLADTGHLSVCEHGAYLLLLMHYWRNGPLPDNDKQLAAIARTDRNVWDRDIGPTVREFFEARDGKLYQKRAEAERAKARDVSEKRRKAAKNRWDGGIETPPTKPNGSHEPDANASPKAPAFANAYVPPNGYATSLQTDTQSQSQVQLEKEPPVGPHEVGTAPAEPGTPSRRISETNPRAQGTNPRAKGTNPRAATTRRTRNGFNDLDRPDQGPPTIDGTAEDFEPWLASLRRIAND